MEVKYRTWDGEKMSYGGGGIHVGNGILRMARVGDSLMLCTGLKDKLGKLIYDGDILNVDDGNRYVQVVWFQPQASFDTKPLVVFNHRAPFRDLHNADWAWRTKIIGNIMENHDFLQDDTARQ